MPDPQTSGVPIRGPDGSIDLYHPHDVAQAVAAGGEVVSHDQLRSAELEKKYGGIGGSLAATGTGLVRGGTLGLSDPIAVEAARALGGTEAAESTRKTLSELQEAHPYLSTAGEIAGAGLSTLGEGAAVRAAGLLPRLASTTGRAVEGSAARALGAQAAGLGARVAQKAIPAAAGAAIEGAAYGAGHELSDAALDDHELTAEKLLAGAGHGALLGAFTGAGLGAASELASSGARGLTRALTKNQTIADWLEKKSGESAFRAAGGTQKMAEAADKFAGGYSEVGKIWREEAPGLVGKKAFSQLNPEELQAAASRGLDQEGQKIGSLLDEVDAAAIRPREPEPIRGIGAVAANDYNPSVPYSREFEVARTRAANDNSPEWEQVHIPGKPAANDGFRAAVHDNGEVRPELSAWRQSKQGLAANDNAARGLGGRQELSLPRVPSANDNAANAVWPNARVSPLPRAIDVVQDIESVAGKLSGHAGVGPVLSKLRSFADDIKKISAMVDETGKLLPNAAEIRMSFRKLRDLRVDADNIWAGSKMNPELMGYRAEFKRVRDLLEERLVNGAEAVAKENGIQFETAYEAAKAKYQAFKMLARASNSGASKGGANQVLGLGDKIVGHGLGNWGAHMGGLMGGAPGALVGGAVGGATGALLNKAVRERGNFVAADLLHRVSQLAAVERVNAEIDRRIAQGVRGFLLAGESSSTEPKKVTKEHALELAHGIAAAQSPAAMQARLEHAIGPLGNTMPGITQNLGMKASSTVSFLGSKLPQERKDLTSLTPNLEKPRTSEAEIRKFARYVDGALDPLSVLDDLKRNQLSHEKVEAMRATSPLLFEQIRDQIIEHAPKLKKRLPYERRLQISILFGAPIDDTLSPEFISAVQSTKGAPPPDKGGPEPDQKLGSRRPMKLDEKLFQSPSEETAA